MVTSSAQSKAVVLVRSLRSMGLVLLAALVACSAKISADDDDDSRGGHGSLLGGAGGAAAGAAGRAGGASGTAGAPGVACPAGEVSCSSACANLSNNPQHCGSCSVACSDGAVCQGSVCQAACTLGLSPCAGACTDTSTSATNCGACGKACGSGQTCVAGSCTCPNGGLLCGSACVDAQTDAAHCGGCTTTCGGTQSCTAGKCVCPAPQMACGSACVDTQTSAEHCGKCDAACGAGATCEAGSCKCAAGQMPCGGSCVDTQTSSANCGACGSPCSMGQTCMAGVCSGTGNAGADGCVGGAALNVSLSRIDAFQSVQVGIMLSGAEVAPSARSTDLVAGRDTLFRVFVTPGTGWAARELSARVTVMNGSASDQYFAKLSVSAASMPADANSTFLVSVPAAKITAQTSFHVELVECGTTASGSAVAPRYPTSADAMLGARTTGGLKIKVVPITIGGVGPATDDAAFAPYRAYMLAMYPITALDISAAPAMTFDLPPNGRDGKPDWSQLDWNGLLNNVAYQRDGDRPPADVYYYGLLAPTSTFKEYCKNACTAGIGFVVQSANDPSNRTAVGIGFANDADSLITMAHEVGHNHGRNHAPCVPQGGSIAGVDPMFPYDGANIGVWGWRYDGTTKMRTLVSPDDPKDYTDIMGYCNYQWISDYTYNGLVERVAAVNGARRVEVDPASLGRWRVLLLDSRGPRWGRSIKEPAPPSGTAESADIFDDHGDVVDQVLVYRTEVSDIGAFSIMVPEPRPGWYAVGVSGSTPHPFAAPALLP